MLGDFCYLIYSLLANEERQGQELLNQLAKATGGLVFFPRPHEIRSVLVGINADLSSQYSLSYYHQTKHPAGDIFK